MGRWIRKIVCVIAAALVALPAQGATEAIHSGGELLIQWVAGQTYERHSFAPDGTLLSRSVLRVGAVHAASGGRIDVQIQITTNSPSGKKDSLRSVDWTCDPGATRMLMDLLMVPLTGAGSALELTVSGPPIRYPRAPAAGAILPPIALEIHVRSGFLSLLGTRTLIRARHRRIEVSGSSRSACYQLSSDVETTTYILGLPLRHRRFRSIETLWTSARLIRHRMTFSDGAYVIIQRLGRSTGKRGECGAAARDPRT